MQNICKFLYNDVRYMKMQYRYFCRYVLNTYCNLLLNLTVAFYAKEKKKFFVLAQEKKPVITKINK